MKKYATTMRSLYTELARYTKRRKTTGSSTQYLRERLACSQADLALMYDVEPTGYMRPMQVRAFKMHHREHKLNALTAVVLNLYPKVYGDRFAADPAAVAADMARLNELDISTRELEVERDALTLNIELLEAVLKHREEEAALLIEAYRNLAAHDLSKCDGMGADDERWKRSAPMLRIRMRLKKLVGRTKMNDEMRLAEWHARLSCINSELAMRSLLNVDETVGISASQDGDDGVADTSVALTFEPTDAEAAKKAEPMASMHEPVSEAYIHPEVVFAASRVKARVLHAVAFIVSFFVCMAVGTAQTADEALIGYAVNPKLGMYTSSTTRGVMGGLELNVFTHRQIFSVDYYRFHQPLLFDRSSSERFNQIALMYGVHKRNGLLRVELQGGLAPIWGVRRTNEVIRETGLFGTYYQTVYFFALGAVGKAGFKFTPSERFAIGIDVQANLNFQRTVVMPMLSVAFGRLSR